MVLAAGHLRHEFFTLGVAFFYLHVQGGAVAVLAFALDGSRRYAFLNCRFLVYAPSLVTAVVYQNWPAVFPLSACRFQRGVYHVGPLRPQRFHNGTFSGSSLRDGVKDTALIAKAGFASFVEGPLTNQQMARGGFARRRYGGAHGSRSQSPARIFR